MSQLDGDLGRQTQTWRQDVLILSARLEALIDFADETLPDGLDAEIRSGLAGLCDDLDKALLTARGGILNRDGISLALVGEPNAGKSTLLNMLAGDDRAIVSPEAGTTRDLVEVAIDVDGVALRLTDTAGIRADAGDIEREGIRRAINRAATAALVLVLVPADSDDPSVAGSGLLMLSDQRSRRYCHAATADSLNHQDRSCRWCCAAGMAAGLRAQR